MDAGKSSIKGKKLVLFKTLAVLIPLVLLLLLEAALRAFNYGHNTALFVKDPYDDRFWVMNYYASDRYFSDTANATKGNQELFRVNKTSNTFRIFVLGESTTIGYPYRFNGSFHRWLQYRLMQMYPGKNFEIINLSLTAVNSYTVLDFGRQIPQYQPDVVLIYTGHNEYYGALGVGSTSYVGNSRIVINALLKLRQLKLTQLISNSIKKIAILFSGKQIDMRETLMKRMAARQQIPLGSADYQAGINQFDKNITELCGIFDDKKIPVFLSTLVSNEKDLPPFISEKDSARSAARYYKLGQLAFAAGNYPAAQINFVKAKEFDELRFRAPGQLNCIIARLAAQYRSVHLVDTRKLFQHYSPKGIIGSETILEHVHPNLFGYAIMAEAFYQQMQKQKLLTDIPDRVMTFKELLKEMPITRMDSLNGLFQIITLKTAWPFNDAQAKKFRPGKSFDDVVAQQVAFNRISWLNGMQQLFEQAKKTNNTPAALKIMEASFLEYPQSEQFCAYSARLSDALKDYNKAAFYYKKQYTLNPTEQLGLSICQMYLKADEPDRALANMEYIPATQQQMVTPVLQALVSDKQLIAQHPNDMQVKQRLFANYMRLGATDTALKYRK